MRQVMFLLLSVAFLSSLPGCNGTHRGIEVIIEGEGSFPQSMVGTWKNDKQGWQFVFEPDGTLSSAVISFARVEMIPGEVTTFTTKGGGKGIFVPGKWEVTYNVANRELSVEIVIDHFYQDMGGNSIEGNLLDFFLGEITGDGEVWYAQWHSFPYYLAHIPEPKILESDPNDNPRETLMFIKVHPENENQ